MSRRTSAPLYCYGQDAMNVIDTLEREQLKPTLPDMRSGDTVKVFSKVVEGGKERTQMFEGVVTARKSGGLGECIVVRRVAHGVGVEKTFLLHSPRVEKIEISKRGIVRRSRLYYLSDLVGKAARIKERKTAR
uniref:Ribosomal protein L19 n=1 Tax=mine drainage metagenome TaxID=410659 RepID=E6PH62_9ZZZZ